MQATEGFDNVSGDRAKDDLDRWRFALDIAEVISGTPKGWSVRIGLFGPWGSGKSTVLRYIGDKFSSEDDVVIHFNPSFESNFSDAVGAFGSVLIEELIRQSLHVEPKAKSWMRKRRGFWESKASKEVVESSSDFWKGAKLLSAGLGVVSLWLKYSAEEIRKIAKKYPDKRFVVLLDDLDRASAEVLPKFLLSLREILDLPNFAFVLAFDDDIVAEALKRQSPEWKNGQDFLEKVLDFRYSLPPVTKDAKRALLKRALKENAPFVPNSSVDAVEDLISDNPREIKALVRGMLSVRSVLERHNHGEFEWTDVWLVQLLRQRSYKLLECLLDEHTFNSVVGIAYKLHKNSSRSGPKDDDPQDHLLAKARVPKASLERVKAIVEAMRARGSFQLHYVLSWGVRQPALTWKEFDEILAEWKVQPTAMFLEARLSSHAEKREDAIDRVQEEFIEALNSRISALMDSTRHVDGTNELEADYQSVEPLMSVVRAFFSIPRTLNPKRFKMRYDQAQFWADMRRTPAEETARNRECRDLLEFAEKLDPGDSLEVYTQLRPWSEFDSQFDQSGARLRLRDGIAAILKPAVVERLVSLLSQKGGVRQLSEVGRFPAFIALIFGEPEWDPKLRKALFDALNSSKDGLVATENADALATMFLHTLAYRPSNLDRDYLLRFASDEELMELFWDALNWRGLLPKGCLRLLGLREKLVEIGVPADYMPLDQQLLAQEDYFKANCEQILRSL